LHDRVCNRSVEVGALGHGEVASRAVFRILGEARLARPPSCPVPRGNAAPVSEEGAGFDDGGVLLLRRNEDVPGRGHGLGRGDGERHGLQSALVGVDGVVGNAEGIGRCLGRHPAAVVDGGGIGQRAFNSGAPLHRVGLAPQRVEEMLGCRRDFVLGVVAEGVGVANGEAVDVDHVGNKSGGRIASPENDAHRGAVAQDFEANFTSHGEKTLR
jgi:hypothetical protein